MVRVVSLSKQACSFCCTELQASDAHSKLQTLIGPLPEGMTFEAWHESKPLICVTFGSMGPMGAIADPSYLVGVLISALRQANAKGVLLTGWSLCRTAAVFLAESMSPKPRIIAMRESK